MGERTRLSQLRTRHQSRGVGSESNHYRDRDLPELRLVWADRNTSCRSSASEEADFSQVVAYALELPARESRWFSGFGLTEMDAGSTKSGVERSAEDEFDVRMGGAGNLSVHGRGWAQSPQEVCDRGLGTSIRRVRAVDFEQHRLSRTPKQKDGT